MKKLLLLSITALLLSVSAFAQSSSGTLKGDVNNDGSVSVTDVTMVISHILGQTPEGFNKDAADINGDGSISVTDVTMIINIILRGETSTEVESLSVDGWFNRSSITMDETATLTINSVTAMYASGYSEVIPSSAYEVTPVKGTLSGNIFTPTSTGQGGVKISYEGKEALVTINITEPATQKKTVQVGHGTDYSNAVFTDTGEQLTQGMHLTQTVSKGDYLFIKIDKTQSIGLITTDNDDPTFNSEIEFDDPVLDEDYKYYKKTNSYPRAITSRVLLASVTQ